MVKNLERNVSEEQVRFLGLFSPEELREGLRGARSSSQAVEGQH